VDCSTEELKEVGVNRLKNLEEDGNCGAKKYWNDEEALLKQDKLYRKVGGIISVCGSILAGSTSVFHWFEENKRLKVIGALSFGVAVLNILSQTEDFRTEAKLRREAAHGYDAMRSKVRFYQQMRFPYLDDYEKGVQFLEGMDKERLNLNKNAPPLYDSNSWIRAKQGIENGEGTYKTDKDE
jgi:hypothetical protein